MAITNEETTLTQGQKGKKEKKQGTMKWQTVAMGGVSGVMLGAGAMYAADAYGSEVDTSGETDENAETAAVQVDAAQAEGIRIAEVDQHLSFGDAFDAARQEVGAGGVFLWHGRLYNTYTADEWQQMGADEQNNFAEQVSPAVHLAERHAPVTPEPVTPEPEPVTPEPDPVIPEPKPVTPEPVTPGPEPVGPVIPEPEVHYVGMDTIQAEDGHTMNVALMTEDGVDVVLIDNDDNGVYDYRWRDENHNHEMDRGEVEDMRSEHYTVAEFAQHCEAELQNGVHQELANNSQEDLAPDMPDYVNDADIQTV